MKKSIIESLCCLLIASSLFVGCGNNATEATEETVVETTEATTVEETSEEVTEEVAEDVAADTEESTESSSPASQNFTIDVKFAVLAYQHIARSQSILAVSEVTNNGDRDYDLGFKKELVAKATQNGQELETLRLGSDSIRDALTPGSTMLIMDGFKAETTDDVTITWYLNGFEIATKTYTTNELIQNSQDYINGAFDTSAYDEEFLFLGDDIKKIMEDIQ